MKSARKHLLFLPLSALCLVAPTHLAAQGTFDPGQTAPGAKSASTPSPNPSAAPAPAASWGAPPASASTAVAPPAPAARTPSSIVTPAIVSIRQAVVSLQSDKWKVSKPVHQDTDTNLNSIRNDIETTLPPLLADADAAPTSVTHLLPATRNLGALYDVLIRVDEVSRIGAPTPQANALAQAVTALQSARHELDDTLQALAVTQEKQLADFRAADAARAAAPPPPPPAPVVAPVVTPVKKKPKPKPKPVTPPAAPPAPQ